MTQILSTVTLLAIIKNGYGLTRDDPIVVTNVGLIQGVRAEDGNYTKFLGVPYATVDEFNYFGDSVPHPPFEGIFEAKDEYDTCPQFDDAANNTRGTLDCMRLNIFVPDSASSTNRLPVLVWLFGGRFEVGFYGTILFGPEFLLRHDVMFVAINYRVNVYGFMCLDIPEVPGNQGLRDQVRALHWIKDNIESFGGDPERITIFGNSAGAMSVGLHLVSDDERVFNSVIMQSGSSIYPSLLLNSDPSVPLKIANELGLTTNDIYEALSYMQAADVHAVVNAAKDADVSFRPCVETRFPGVNSFLTDHPVNIKHTKTSGISILHGYTDKEALFNFGSHLYTPFAFYSYLNNSFNFDEDMREELEPIIRRFYIGDAEIVENVKSELIDFFSDISFIYPPVRSVARFLNGEAEKVYQYVFTYDGPRNYMKHSRNIDFPGVAHGDEIGYLFQMEDGCLPEPTTEDQLIIDRMTLMWTNFAKYNDPTPEINSVLPYKWEPITRDSPYHYMEINTEMVAGMRHLNRRMSFWDLFYDTYGNYEIGYREENPDIEEPVTDTPSTETLSTEIPVTVTLSTETPSTETPSTEISETFTPSTETPSTDPPLTDASFAIHLNSVVIVAFIIRMFAT